MSDVRSFSVPIPADVEREDKILANLTARQLAILASAAVVLWLLFIAVRDLVPLVVFAALALPIAGAATAAALMTRDGLSLDRLLLAALRQARTPRRMVAPGEQVPDLPAWVDAPNQPLPAPLRLPAQAIRPDGAIDLGGDGVAVIVACSTVSFALRTPEEQAGLVAAFARYLNSLAGPIQILVRAERVNLTASIHTLVQAARALPHPALERAALDHAHFLEELATTRDLLYRQVLLVVREPRSGHGDDLDAAATRAHRRAEEAGRHLAAAGISAATLDGPMATAVLAAAADPSAPPMEGALAAASEVITGPEGTWE